MIDLIHFTPDGLYCPGGDFTIDPRRPVKRAVITHAHADHARGGSGSYLCAEDSQPILQHRLGAKARIQTLAYGEVRTVNGIRLSLHPAGHIRGAAQVRLEKHGFVGVVSGDYKTAHDPTCMPLEPQSCHSFISESTFGLPIFKWPSTDEVIREIQAWWAENQARNRTSILFAYALGKAQRVLAGLDAAMGPILTHGAVETINRLYREAGVDLPPTQVVEEANDTAGLAKALVLAPPSADNPGWMRRFKDSSRAFASGWMRIRGHRRRRAVDRGFVLSDHADWEGLVSTIVGSGAERIHLTHGYAPALASWLRERGFSAAALEPGDVGVMQGGGT